MSQSLTWTQRPADAHTARHAQPGGWAVVLLVYVLGCRFAAYLLGAKLVAVAGVAFEPIGLLEHPVNMFERPCQLVVVGLVIGVVLTVPVVLAAVAGAFWGVGAGVSAAVLGPSPLLGLASAAGAVLVGLRRVPRVSPGKRLAIALALAPSVWLVWVVISPTGNLPGAARWVACVPIAVAGLVAAGAWRPAARHDAAGPTDSSVWGVACAVLLTASAALVHGAVGWDEIRFGSLLREHGPDAGHFVSTPIDARQPRESAQTDTTDARRRRSLSGVQAAIHVQQYLAERKQAASAAWLRSPNTTPAADTRPRSCFCWPEPSTPESTSAGWTATSVSCSTDRSPRQRESGSGRSWWNTIPTRRRRPRRWSASGATG